MYRLELDKLIAEIKKRDAKRVLVQLPDGLKHKADQVVHEVEKETDATACIWFGSCFGSCDIPLGLENVGIDMLVQWGHNRFVKQKW